MEDNKNINNESDIKLKAALKQCMDTEILRVILSNPKNDFVESPDKESGRCGMTKVKGRPVKLGDKIVYQTTEYIGTQVFHENHSKEELLNYIFVALKNGMKQCEISAQDFSMTVLMSKKGKATVSRKNSTVPMIKPEIMSHNRTKKYILREDIKVDFLVDLGVMTKEGKIVTQKFDKFKQINRFLEFIRDIKDELPKDREINIIDFGCGKSYLTFAIYYYLHELCGLDVRITGLDLKADVIKKCNDYSKKYGYEKLQFKMGDIADYTDQDKVDMVVTLHACDTATDYALFKAVSWNAKVILSVPCCQHEINGQIKNDLLSPVLKYGILKDRISAIMTDAIRAEVLKTKGYDTEILEFIDMEHTPKNLLIRAVKKNKIGNAEKTEQALEKMIEEMEISPTIVRLFQ